MEMKDKFIQYLVPFVSEAFNLSEQLAIEELKSYYRIFGYDGLKSMVAFCQWANEEKCTVNFVYETIAHDIQYKDEEYMSPRTRGYLKHFDPKQFTSES